MAWNDGRLWIDLSDHDRYRANQAVDRSACI